MKNISATFLAAVLALATSAGAQTAVPAIPKIVGTLNIDFQTRSGDTPAVGTADIYKVNLAVTDSLVFAGTVKAKPYIAGALSAVGYGAQGASVDYDIGLQVKNPANPTQTKTVGKFVGAVPIDRKGTYRYQDGTLRIAIDATGRAADFTSTFRGTAAGKAPEGAESVFDKVAKQKLSISKLVRGEAKQILVTKYDQMGFDGLVLAAGPVRIYPEATVGGSMVYDYDRSAWYFKDVTIAYVVDGKDTTDRISGNIRWIEDPMRASNGKGQYEFDVRVNEPLDAKATTEAAVFAPTDDESAFFATDTGIPSLTGTAKYVDTMSGETVRSSKVDVDLTGNGLNKQQTVNLAKLIWLVNIVPMNAE